MCFTAAAYETTCPMNCLCKNDMVVVCNNDISSYDSSSVRSYTTTQVVADEDNNTGWFVLPAVVGLLVIGVAIVSVWKRKRLTTAIHRLRRRANRNSPPEGEAPSIPYNMDDDIYMQPL